MGLPMRRDSIFILRGPSAKSSGVTVNRQHRTNFRNDIVRQFALQNRSMVPTGMTNMRSKQPCKLQG